MGEAGKALVFSYWLRRRNLDRHRAGARETAPSGERGRVRLLLRRGVKHAVDLNDIVVEQPLDLDHGPGRIGRAAPQLGLRLVDHRRVAVQVAYIDGEPHAILEARALGLGDQVEIAAGLNDARLR